MAVIVSSITLGALKEQQYIIKGHLYCVVSNRDSNSRNILKLRRMS